MAEQKIIEGCVLIMFFDGAKNSSFNLLGKRVKAIKYKEAYWPNDRPPRFDKDWNSLMEAIKKWDALPMDEMTDSVAVEYAVRCDEQDNAVTRNYDLREAFDQLVKNIQWYNSKQGVQASVASKAKSRNKS